MQERKVQFLADAGNELFIIITDRDTDTGNFVEARAHIQGGFSAISGVIYNTGSVMIPVQAIGTQDRENLTWAPKVAPKPGELTIPPRLANQTLPPSDGSGSPEEVMTGNDVPA